MPEAQGVRVMTLDDFGTLFLIVHADLEGQGPLNTSAHSTRASQEAPQKQCTGKMHVLAPAVNNKLISIKCVVINMHLAPKRT